METYISIALITLSVLLVASVLLQQMGMGLSSTFGGGGAAYQTRRGFEKILFRANILFGILIIIGSIVYLAL
ncbi:preprotein translocase subunit SecG [bacterium]|nr:preprotein translocase subunit SecG [Candidatus Elulimicrobium humile]